MAGITLAQAESALAYWLEADERLASGRSVSSNGRSIDRAETTEKIEYWQGWIERLDPSATANRRGLSAHRLIVRD